MRIGLLGQFGSGNSGNDGSLEAMVRFLRRAHPDAEIISICSRPAVVADALDIRTTGISADTPAGRAFALFNKLLIGAPQRFLNLAEAFRKVRGLDWMIVPGTGILDDFRDTPFGWPFVLWRWCAAARLNGVDVAFANIGAGPIRHPLSRLLLTSAARMARYRSYRDRISRDFMASVGLEVGKDTVVPDIAFTLPTPSQQAAAPRRSLTVGIGVMSYRGWLRRSGDGEHIYEAYLSKLARFALILLQRGYHLRLLTGDVADWAAVQDFLKHLHGLSPERFQTRITAEKAESLAELMEQLQDVDLVVATRFHNVVCALKLGLPTISLSYADKNNVLLAECGLGEFHQHVETFDVDRLAEQFGRLVADREVFARRVRVSLAAFADQLAQQEAVLSAMLARNPRDSRRLDALPHLTAASPKA